jgi:hypothetical protein
MSTNKHNRLAEAALATALTVGAIVPGVANAQQPRPASSGADTTIHLAERGPERDPNIPPLISQRDFPVVWVYHNVTLPTMHFKNPPGDGYYLGFNEQGSLIENQNDKKIYQWNINSGTLNIVYPNIAAIPLDVVASLRNPNGRIDDIIAENRPKPPAKPTEVAKNTSPPSVQEGIFNDPKAVGGAIAGLLAQRQAGSPPPGAHTIGEGPGDKITGTGASVAGGILSFTASDGSKKAYKVVRPGNNVSASAGDFGAWLVVDKAAEGFMLTVQPDKSVAGGKLPDMVYQALKAQAAQQR